MRLDLGERILEREISNKLSQRRAYRDLYGNASFIKDLDIVNELDGHSGCVNALSWSRSGRLLASGSDDQHLNIHAYQPDSSDKQFQLQTTVATGHTQNIFSVKFMPQSDDRTVVTVAGDGDVRVFDLEYAGGGSETSAASARAAASRRARRNNLYNGVRYLTDGDTNARVYRSHGDRVKRIVTEQSAYTFLTCSEDGTVRQWDTRQKSEAYPRPRGGRYAGLNDGDAPPPLISYQHYNLDLNTISCSPSQPHYIALGGAHLHCFLHDRRMIGRDLQQERGGRSRRNADLNQATRCVRRFAPKGQQAMEPTSRGHITACKISDARPDEMVVSWSHDYIYSFDLIRSPDADEVSTEEPQQSAEHNRVRDHGVKKKRKTVTEVNEAATLRIRYQNGQQEDVHVADSQLTPAQSEARRLTMAVLRLRETFFDRCNKDRFTKALGQCAAMLSDIDSATRGWSYPVEPSSDDLKTQQELRAVRESVRRFVQAAGTISRVLGGKLQTPGDGTGLLDQFLIIDNRATDRQISADDVLIYDMIKAILIWLDSGHGRLIEAFTRPQAMSKNATQAKRLPIAADEASSEAIDEILIPYLQSVVVEVEGTPLYDPESNQFETDKSRLLYNDQNELVDAFSQALSLPFADLSSATPGSTNTINRQEAIQYWGLRVSRGLLMQAYDRIDMRLAEVALGGTRTILDRHILATDVPVEEVGDVETLQTEAEHVGSGSAPTNATETSDDEDNVADYDEDVEVMEEEDDDDDMEYYLAEDDDDDMSEEDDEEDGVPNTGLPGYMYRHVAEQERRRHRNEVGRDVPCNSATRTFKGHCNVKTVKDVNYFGMEDEYVVSGSDDGNVFIWDRKTGKLINILEGDGEVVNVVQGHPYETMLAVSGIDHTIKIFSPDNHAREIARLGQGVSAHDPSTFSSLAWPNRITTRRTRDTAEDTTLPNNIEDEDNSFVADSGLASRKRWHTMQQIVERNEQGRRRGNDDAVITRSMLWQLAQRMREHRAQQGGDADIPLEGLLEDMQDEEGRPRVILGDDCVLM